MSELAGDQRRTYGPYEIESVLGRGAMGMVYLARDKRIGRKVALKTVHVEERFDDESEAREFFRRLQREAELCGALQHPNIVTLYEPGYDNDIITWLATEYIDGESLRERMKKRKPLPLTEALRIAEDVLRGLTFAHGKGIVHRDIKPANILLTSAGEAKIADFGIARPVDSDMTGAGEMLGTPSYMSPEQVKCTAVTARSDLFSLGAVLYEMATGVKAFVANDVSNILRHVVEVEPRLAHEVHPQVPQSLSAFLGRLLAKNPDDRYPDAATALSHLQVIRAEVALAPAEEAGGDEAVSTLAAMRFAGTSREPSVTSVSTEDLTPAVLSRGSTTRTLNRPIPTPMFVSITALLLLILGGAALAIYVRSDEEPTVTLSDAQLQSFADKRHALDAARQLYSSGEYDRALKAYDAFLERYPGSLVAQDERLETLQAIEAAKSAGSKINVGAKRTTKKSTTPAKDQKRPGFWRRLFGRG